MSKINRRAVLLGTAVSAVAGPSMAAPVGIMTPRARRLLDLFAQHEQRVRSSDGGYDDAAICDECSSIGEAILAAPAASVTGLVELAAYALY